MSKKLLLIVVLSLTSMSLSATQNTETASNKRSGKRIANEMLKEFGFGFCVGFTVPISLSLFMFVHALDRTFKRAKPLLVSDLVPTNKQELAFATGIVTGFSSLCAGSYIVTSKMYQLFKNYIIRQHENAKNLA